MQDLNGFFNYAVFHSKMHLGIKQLIFRLMLSVIDVCVLFLLASVFVRLLFLRVRVLLTFRS